MSFENLKKQSKLGSLTDKLVKEVEKMSTGSNGADERFWKPEMDKTGVGSAIIRFLPAPEGEELPWVKMYSHAFQGNGGWYIENSLTTLGQKDPVSEHNRDLWNSGSEKIKKLFVSRNANCLTTATSTLLRILHILRTKVKYSCSNSVKRSLIRSLNAMQPEFEDEEPINPFDFWGGANFRLKIRKVEGYWNYDKSEFDSSSALFDDDDALEALWKKEYSLSAIVAPDQFKSYEDLEKRLKYVLGQKSARAAVQEQEDEYESYVQTPSKEENVIAELEQSFARSKSTPSLPVVESNEDEDDALSYFQRLAED
jgi:hypothetical protein